MLLSSNLASFLSPTASGASLRSSSSAHQLWKNPNHVEFSKNPVCCPLYFCAVNWLIFHFMCVWLHVCAYRRERRWGWSNLINLHLWKHKHFPSLLWQWGADLDQLKEVCAVKCPLMSHPPQERQTGNPPPPRQMMYTVSTHSEVMVDKLKPPHNNPQLLVAWHQLHVNPTWRSGNNRFIRSIYHLVHPPLLSTSVKNSIVPSEMSTNGSKNVILAQCSIM